jgi:hypothetical protein
MKTILKFASIALLTAFTFSASAEDKAVTLKGEGKCGKCALKKTEKCQNVVEVKDGEKTVVYYLKGEASDKFHSQICSSTKKVELTGVVSEKDGQKWITVKEIKAI